ncbi:MAG: addiction module protein [Pirellulales bacterium]|nr:addiction module protein [Pirellulales bacterium]
MSVNINELLALPTAEKERICYLLWEDIEASREPAEISEDVKQEVKSRRQQMIDDPNCGVSHEEFLRRIRADHE